MEVFVVITEEPNSGMKEEAESLWPKQHLFASEHVLFIAGDELTTTQIADALRSFRQAGGLMVILPRGYSGWWQSDTVNWVKKHDDD